MRCAQVGRDPGEQPNAEATGRRNKIIEGNRLLNILLFFAFLFFFSKRERTENRSFQSSLVVHKRRVDVFEKKNQRQY